MSVCMCWPCTFAKRNLRESQCGTTNLTAFACLRAYGKQINNLSFTCGCLGWSNAWTVVRRCAVTVGNVCGILQIYNALSFPLCCSSVSVCLFSPSIQAFLVQSLNCCALLQGWTTTSSLSERSSL